jgi:hypothetical protein
VPFAAAHARGAPNASKRGIALQEEEAGRGATVPRFAPRGRSLAGVQGVVDLDCPANSRHHLNAPPNPCPSGRVNPFVQIDEDYHFDYAIRHNPNYATGVFARPANS